MARIPTPDPRLDPAFPHLKRLIIERTGHFYYQDKEDLLWERVRRRIQALNARDCAGYLERLADQDEGEAEWSKLESEITIGETFFFRYAEQFAALRQMILPAIIEKNLATRRIRIWSAGCATGAEPYSVAILLTELLGSERDSWRINIVGTDINEAFLDTARTARFGKWALRSVPTEDRDRYFVPEEDRWLLRPQYRSFVRFERHNLLSLLDNTSPLQFTDFDLVLCRNVLIYFHPDTVVRIVGALAECLVQEGWLLIGHAEPNPAFATLLEALSLPGTTAYRRPRNGVERSDGSTSEETLSRKDQGQKGQSQESQPWSPLAPKVGTPSPAPPSDPVERAGRNTAPQARPAQAPPARSLLEPDTLLSEVRTKANAGAIHAARELCERALQACPMSSELYFYQGLLSQEAGLRHEAEKSFRRAIYLNKSFAMAHYHLGLLLIESGRLGPGRRSMANAARLAVGLPGDQPLPEGDGVTAAEMKELVRLHLEALARAGRGR